MRPAQRVVHAAAEVQVARAFSKKFQNILRLPLISQFIIPYLFLHFLKVYSKAKFYSGVLNSLL